MLILTECWDVAACRATALVRKLAMIKKNAGGQVVDVLDKLYDSLVRHAQPSTATYMVRWVGHSGIKSACVALPMLLNTPRRK